MHEALSSIFAPLIAEMLLRRMRARVYICASKFSRRTQTPFSRLLPGERRTGGWEKAEKAARVAFDQPACAPSKKVVSYGLK
jgi:hypothetical protein